MITGKTYQQINRIHYNYIPVILLAALSVNVLSLALPLTMKQIYNRVIVYQAFDTLNLLIMGCIIALVLESLMKNIKNSSSKWISSKQEFLLTTFFTDKMLNSSPGGTDKINYSASLEKFNSIPRITNFFSTNFFQIIVDLPFMLLFLFLIYYLAGYLVVVPVFLSLLYVFVMIVIAKFYFNKRFEQVETNDKLMSQLAESLEKIHLIKAAGLEEFQIKKFKKSFDSSTEAGFKVNSLKLIPGNISTYFSQLVLFSVICAGGYLMINGDLFFGEITASALLAGRAVNPVQNLMNSYLQLHDVRLLRQKLDKVASYEEQYSADAPPFPADLSGTIELIGVRYKTLHNYIAGALSCRIQAGDFVHINPAEFLSYRKIINMIIGLEKIEDGKILIDNLDITEWNMNNLKGKIEYLSDKVDIFKGSVMDNITYFSAEKNRDAYDAAGLTGFDKLVTRMPDGFETQLDTHAANYLSSAFLQRLNLTRALLYRPRILLLDRIDESMDSETLQLFIWLLKKLKNKATILVATNNYQIIELADKKMTAGGLFDA